MYAIQIPFLRKNVFLINDQNFSLKNQYKIFLLISLLGSLLELVTVGLPIISGGGRDDYSGLPVVHVFFYSFSIISILYSSLYSSKKDVIFCTVMVLMLSIVWLSRQLMMVSFLILLLSMVVRNREKILPWGKILAGIVGVLFLFGIVGNFRQKLAGDYVANYILKIGGANSAGEKLGDVLYWIWLYLASPIYNLILNINNFYNFGSRCNYAVYYGSCSGSYLSAVILPDTFVKYFSEEKFKLDLIISYLNVGTGYSEAARIMGLHGVGLQILLHGLFFFLGFKMMPIRAKNVFIVYYSALSIFMIFNNTFVKGELFIVFVILFLMRFKFKSD
ncbi:TPA: hypothetical protein R1Q66_003680 [Acinetobacter baumannii]|nr:hypothetical protein [Acinetobacter baumannii]HEC0300394.1 hypothetical protein [Acinetobacter baumannii]HEE5795708.1 hypothetical protein [Acinetobacter baumannii]